jgi:hypothetical protein
MCSHIACLTSIQIGSIGSFEKINLQTIAIFCYYFDFLLDICFPTKKQISMKIYKLCTILVFCLLANTKLWACVFSDYTNVYIFGINLLSNPQYTNYFYNSPYAEDQCLPGNEKNIAEWQKKYPEITNLEFFHEFIYKAELQDLQKVYNALQGGANPFPKNDFVTLLLNKKDKEAIEYLLFAKKCEGLVSMRFGWEFEEQKDKNNSNQQEQAKKLLENGKTLLENSTNTYFKQRYAFQLVRLAYYHDTDQTSAIFDKIVSNSDKNYIYYRTLLHKGFALKKLGKNADANIIFGEVFANSPDLRCLAFKNMAIYKKNDKYGGIDEQVWEETLAKTTDKDLKAALYMLRASREYGIQATFLQSSLDNGASPEQLELMLLKQLKAAEAMYFLPDLQKTVQVDSTALTFGEAVTTETATVSKGFFARIWDSIVNFFRNLFGTKTAENKQNKEVLTAQVYSTDTPSNNKTENISENANLLALEKASLAIAEKYKEKSGIFYLGAAYIQIMRKQFELASNNITQAKNTSKDQNLLQQALYLETLQAVLQAETVEENLENIVAKNTLALWGNVQQLNNGWQRLLLFSELGRKYLRQGEMAKAILSFQYCKQYDVAGMLLDFYCNQADLDKFLVAIQGEADSEIKKLFWKELPKTDAEKNDFVKDLQATRFLREGKLSSALAKFKEISAGYWQATKKEYEYKEFDASKDAPASTWGAVMEGIREDALSANAFSYSWQDECVKIRTNFSTIDYNAVLNDTFPNKMAFVEKLVALETQAQTAKGDEAAKIYMTMANAMYHTPFWLYNNHIWGCGGMLDAMRSSSPIHYPFNISTEFATQFHNRKMHLVLVYCIPYLSSIYNKKAAEVAVSKEIKATALFGQGGAWNKSLASYWENGIKTDKTAFEVLLKEYANTPEGQMASRCMR